MANFISGQTQKLLCKHGDEVRMTGTRLITIHMLILHHLIYISISYFVIPVNVWFLSSGLKMFGIIW